MDMKTVSYLIPVLSVKFDGRVTVPDSGSLCRCPFEYHETEGDAPVKVSIVEDVPSGAGNSLRASIWLAVTTAALALNRDLAGVRINVEITGCVDGPSAGGMLCLAVMSALEGKSFPDDFAMTGTIMVDGTVGAVGGVAEKIRAASKAGIKRICIPAAVRLDEDYTDLLDLGRELKVEVRQVSTIKEAYQVLHQLPARQTVRLNPVEICRLSPLMEDALKDRFALFAEELPRDEALWNETIRKSVGEFCSGLFGAAVQDMKDGLNQLAVPNLGEAPDVERYPALEHELQRGGEIDHASRKRYVDALVQFHHDLKNAEAAQGNDPLGDDGLASNVLPARSTVVNPSDGWFDDYVASPGAAQFVSCADNDLSSVYTFKLMCDDITREIDGVGDWGCLSAEALNEIRNRLMAKQGLLAFISSYAHGFESRERSNDFLRCLYGMMPYVRPNENVRRVENLFYRTMMALDSTVNDMGLQEEHFFVRSYRILKLLAEDAHQSNDALRAVFSETNALSWACTILICSDPALADNSAFFNSAVTTARENALANIAECQKGGIPCVMPVIDFQSAESKRDVWTSDDDAEFHKCEVFDDYLSASISARALLLCFGGQKIELNEKGYCIRREIWNPKESSLTVRYFGTDGEPVLRDGFSGYRRVYRGAEVESTSWLNLSGLAVRFQSADEFSVAEYDETNRIKRKTYCNASWTPTTRADGIQFEAYGYDEAGNRTSMEFFGRSGALAVDKDGVARVVSRFDARGNVTSWRFFDENGRLTAHRRGNAGFDVAYDRHGNLLRFTNVDCSGMPVVTEDGYAVEERKYNAQGNEIERSWHDAQGKLICVGGYAKTRSEYDDRGDLTELNFLGADEQLVRNADNVAIIRWTLNQLGEPLACSYYGPDGKPTRHRDGSASWKEILDSLGRVIGRKYYDVNGDEIDMSKGARNDEDSWLGKLCHFFGA